MVVVGWSSRYLRRAGSRAQKSRERVRRSRAERALAERTAFALSPVIGFAV